MQYPESGPFRIIIAGPGGTGKSHIYDALRSFYNAVNLNHELVFTAPTGVAASNIGASTTASYASL
ncbi:hypothetical protein GYMLUDRAFT_149201, partial [Collybiopsis luxurians FD-317 M1]